MQLTRAADYAVRVMIHLAGLPVGARASRGELASAGEVPEQFVSKVLQVLARAGLITSYRGSAGGFELAREGGQITLLNVVEAVEGPLRLNFCLTSEHACGRHPWCAAHLVWGEAQKAMTEVLEAATIAQLARDSAARRWKLHEIEG
jgi:Rrf2 family protein